MTPCQREDKWKLQSPWWDVPQWPWAVAGLLFGTGLVIWVLLMVDAVSKME